MMGFRQCIEVVYGMYPPILRYLIVLAFTLHILGVARYVNKQLNTKSLLYYIPYLSGFGQSTENSVTFYFYKPKLMPFNYGYSNSIKDFV